MTRLTPLDPPLAHATVVHTGLRQAEMEAAAAQWASEVAMMRASTSAANAREQAEAAVLKRETQARPTRETPHPKGLPTTRPARLPARHHH